jgi:hypothetical protein
MQTSVAALLFVTSTVILASVVVEYAVVTCEQTIDTENSPQIDRIRELEDMMLNQTDNMLNEVGYLSQTGLQPTDTATP